jgi:hypothetical protein
MRNLLACLAGLLVVVATVPYIVDTLKGKTKPNAISWFTWSLLGALGAAAAISGHATQTAIFTASLALCNLGVVVASLPYGIKRYTGLDIACQLLAVAGIVLWRVTNNPSLAVTLVILSDFIGAIPTYRHIWRSPYEETLRAYVLFVVASVVTIFSLASFRYISAAYPIYIVVNSVLLVTALLYCRHSRKQVTLENRM